jgi:hypothetical protein
MPDYVFSVQGDTKRKRVAEHGLSRELGELPFFEELSGFSVRGDALTIVSRKKLTAAEKKKLDVVVSAHEGDSFGAPDERFGARVEDLGRGLYEGQRTYATDGRKTGEEKGLGTGVPVYWSQGAWRRYSDDKAVSA